MIPSPTHTTPAVTDLDDELAVGGTAGEALAAIARGLRLALRAVESWSADPVRLGCLCPAAAHLRTALALVDGTTPPRLRRSATWTGPADPDLVYPYSTVTRILGRAVRILLELAGRGWPPATRPGALGVVLDAEQRAECRAAFANAFHAMVRVMTVQAAESWSGDSETDPWDLLAAEAPVHAVCEQCAPPPDPPGGPASARRIGCRTAAVLRAVMSGGSGSGAGAGAEAGAGAGAEAGAGAGAEAGSGTGSAVGSRLTSVPASVGSPVGGASEAAPAGAVILPFARRNSPGRPA